MQYDFVTDSYDTERLKVLSVWISSRREPIDVEAKLLVLPGSLATGQRSHVRRDGVGLT